MMLAGFVSLLVYTLQFNPLTGFSVGGVGIIVAAAAMMAGGLLGLLFGVPRTLEGERKTVISPSSRSEDYPDTSTQPVTYHGNSNLEVISDWLTSILVGITLTQLPAIHQQINLLATALKPALGNVDSSPSFAIALIVYFSICGFFTGFLYSRVLLLSLFRKAEQEDLLVRVAQVEASNRQIQQGLADQQKNDTQALILVERQLNPKLPEVPVDELEQTLKAASSPLKQQIFEKAHQVRKDNWCGNKALMERTIPIFRALTKSDPENKRHPPHGELGYTLKYQRSPDWHQAELSLTEAINLRGNWREHQHRTLYEFNRAICRIQQGLNSEADQKAILDDLAIAAQSRTFTEGDLHDLDPANQLDQTWMSTHNYEYEDLQLVQTWMATHNYKYADLLSRNLPSP